MNTAHEIVEERILFQSDTLNLSGILAYPEIDEPQSAVLLCSPHPHFAGDMDNNVIEALARHFAERAVTLRFNYRGVGESEFHLTGESSVFDYWNEVEEYKRYTQPLQDVQAAFEALQKSAPGFDVYVIGYSFGAIMGLLHGLGNPNVNAMAGISPPLARYSFNFLEQCPKPCLLLSGTDDFVYAEQEAQFLKEHGGSHLKIELLDGMDHFFRGHEQMLAEKVQEFLAPTTDAEIIL